MSNLPFRSSRVLVELYSFSKKQGLVDIKHDRRSERKRRKRMGAVRMRGNRRKKVDVWYF